MWERIKRYMSKHYFKVMCDYCGNRVPLVDSKIVYGKSYGNIFYCEPCGAWVGVHKSGIRKNTPLGRLANAELREWKKLAHAAFDPLWKDGQITRSKAYSRLAQELGVEEIHVGESDVETCMRIIIAANKLRGEQVHPSFRTMKNFKLIEEEYERARGQELSASNGLLC